MLDIVETPLTNDFLAAFGVEPSEEDKEDGYWQYLFDGPSGSTLVFSFNSQECSVQTTLKIDEHNILTMASEGMISIRLVDDREIHVAFSNSTSLVIRVFPSLLVEWHQLIR